MIGQHAVLIKDAVQAAPEAVAYNPTVSAILTTFREKPEYLRRAIDSILNQTFSDLELIVVFEKSDANTEFVNTSYEDPRVVIIRNDGKPSRTACFNLGLSKARGRYIMRLDSDDVAYPDRLEKQITFLQKNKDIGLVGSGMRLIGPEGEIIASRLYPSSHEAILHAIAFTNPFPHPTVTWDRERVGYDLRYNESFYYCEDLELWLRLMSQGCHFANLPEVLVDYSQPTAARRDRAHWRANLLSRRKNWRLIIRNPRMICGFLALTLLTVLPKGLTEAIIRPNRLSNWIRLSR